MRPLSLFALGALLLAGGPASAATLTLATDGADTNDGVQAPFKTLQKAMSAVRDGDTLVIRAGTYTAGSGLQKLSRVTIRGEGEVVLDGTAAQQKDGLEFDGVQNLTLENLKIRNCPRNGIYAYGAHGLTVRRCESSNNGRTGILTGNLSDVLIEDSVCSGNKAEHGIYLSRSGDRLKVVHNRLFDNQKAGLQINAVQTDNVDRANPDQDALSQECLISGNTVYGNGGVGGAAFNLMGVRKSLIVNNLIYNNLAGGIALWDDEAGPEFACGEVRVVHNTVVFPNGKGRYGIRVVKGSVGCELLNNIVVCGDGPALDLREAVKSDYNLLSGPSLVNRDSLAAWRGATGNDRHSLEGDPELTSEYRLSSRSRARHAGSPALDTDLMGRKRSKDAHPDLGCFEDSVGDAPRGDGAEGHATAG